MRGPLGDRFDLCDKTDSFGKRTWETSESEMARLCLSSLLVKARISHKEIDLLVAGDLQNQCVGSSVGLSSFGIPYLSVYGACSTCTEALLIACAMQNAGASNLAAAVTSSHNCAAERQFRTPLEYGSLRSPSAQWTATAAGAFLISKDEEIAKRLGSSAVIRDFMVGRVIDGATKDSSNMGGAMSFAAIDSILTYFEHSDTDVKDFDYIVTGDLGYVGSSILKEELGKVSSALASKHLDCGTLLYDGKKQDIHAGASGCGTSAAVLSAYFLPMLEKGEIHDVLFLSTGALMNPSSILQGNNIAGVAPVIHIQSTR